MKKGISLAVLSVIILVMVILATAATTTGTTAINSSKKMKFASEIMFVQEIVNEYKKNTEEYPINNSVSIDLSNVKDSSKFQFDKETKKGQTITLYEIDFSLLEKTDLINGNKKNNDQTDIYAVSEKTGIVYYLKGVKVSNLTYYTLTDDLKEIIGYDMSETSQNNTQENEDTDLPVIEVLSTQAMVNEKSNEKSTYIKVNIKDTYSGVKFAKYETNEIAEQGIKQYFSNYGIQVKDNTIVVDKYVTTITIYAEDNSGNYSYKVVNLDSILSEKDYIKDGLVVHYDGINNTGDGHSDETKIWKNLALNNFEGDLRGFDFTLTSGWTSKGLKFDGIDDWVYIGECNYDNVTLEAVIKYDAISNNEAEIICNFQSGGYGLCRINQKNRFSVFLRDKNGYEGVSSNNNAQVNKIYSLAGSYDNKNVVFYENGVRKELASASSIVKTTQQSVLVLGMDPMGNSVYVSQGVEYLKGEIMSIRVYNRALSQSEIQKNYKIDKIRFGI